MLFLVLTSHMQSLTRVLKNKQKTYFSNKLEKEEGGENSQQNSSTNRQAWGDGGIWNPLVLRDSRCLHTEMAGNDGRRVRVMLWGTVLTTVRMERRNDAIILVQIKALPLTSCVGNLILCFKLQFSHLQNQDDKELLWKEFEKQI